MQTKQLYLDDSYLKEMEAVILEVQPETENKWKVILDQTVFYPMGGGQPTDQGSFTNDNWKVEVYLVMMKDGEIWHYLNSPTPPKVGDKIHGTINWDRRYKNMRVHSAGHIIDFAMHVLGYSPKPLLPTKGDHGKKSFIIYQGSLNEDIKQELEDKSNELIEKDLKFSCLFQPLEDLQKEAIYLQPGLPTDKPLRTLRLESVGAVADGGTQIHSAREVGKITIPNIETKEGKTIVHYQVV
jgi:Ser-tRNA(Ala) deacylase AlaX